MSEPSSLLPFIPLLAVPAMFLLMWVLDWLPQRWPAFDRWLNNGDA